MTTVYVLLCENAKYYVGVTNDVMFQYREHRDGNGAEWTRLHKPLFLENTIDNVSPSDEERITKEYMAVYGIDNVRGASYTNTHLTPQQVDKLARGMHTVQGLCTQCGDFGHFANMCTD